MKVVNILQTALETKNVELLLLTLITINLNTSFPGIVEDKEALQNAVEDMYNPLINTLDEDIDDEYIYSLLRR